MLRVLGCHIFAWCGDLAAGQGGLPRPPKAIEALAWEPALPVFWLAGEARVEVLEVSPRQGRMIAGRLSSLLANGPSCEA